MFSLESLLDRVSMWPDSLIREEITFARYSTVYNGTVTYIVQAIDSYCCEVVYTVWSHVSNCCYEILIVVTSTCQQILLLPSHTCNFY